MTYLERLRPKFPKKTDLELELMLINTPGVERLTGIGPHEHRLIAMAKMFPSRVDHEWRRRMIWSYQDAMERKIKELMWIGASNSNKTGTGADLAVDIWMESPANTSIYIASPYEKAAETGLWARVQEQFQEALQHNHELPGRLKFSENAIVLYDANPLSFIGVITIDQVGKLVGQKSRTFGQGRLIIITDELPEFRRNGEALVRVMDNLRSVPNMMLIGAGNFASPTDGLGTFCEPAREGGYEGLRLESDFEWPTVRGGMCYRFSGEQSPNVLAGRDIYDFLPTLEYKADLILSSGGKKSAGMYRYWHSFPQLDLEEFNVTNQAKVRAGGSYDEVTWTADVMTLGAGLDPGFGGDPCILHFWRTGWTVIEGEQRQIYEARESVVVPVEVASETTVDDQIAEYCKKQCEERGILPDNFGFDDSMRSGIVQALMRVWSPKVVAISAGGPATTRKLSAVKQTKDPNEKTRKVKTAKDEYVNFATEMCFAVGSLIQSGQFRGAGHAQEAIKQICRRRWNWVGKKKQIEIKDDYKRANSGRSPNHGDALVIGVETARRRGLVLEGVSLVTGGAVKTLLAMQREKAWSKKVNPENQNGLPSGRLNGIARSPTGNGKLNAFTR